MISMRIISCLVGLALCSAVQAIEYTRLVPDKSSIAFVYRQMNVPLDGEFKRFSSRLSFDPQKPQAGSAQFEIDLASIDTGSTDVDEEVAGKLWFNIKDHPQARFVSTAIRPLGQDRVEVSGNLSIKGRTHKVTAPVTVRHGGGNAFFEGSFVIRRADYAIGEGVWADYGTVANEVQIRFRLLAAAVPPKK